MRVLSFIEMIVCFTAAVACGEEVAPKIADTLQPITLKQSELSARR